MAVRAQSAYETARSGSLGIRLDGGLSWSLGGGFANTGGNTLTVIQPQGNVGLYYNLSPRFRAGLDYNYSRMIRSQMNNTQSPFPDGDGEVFRDLKTHFHGAEFTCEFNLVGSGRISLYAGLGVGCLFSVGLGSPPAFPFRSAKSRHFSRSRDGHAIEPNHPEKGSGDGSCFAQANPMVFCRNTAARGCLVLCSDRFS